MRSLVFKEPKYWQVSGLKKQGLDVAMITGSTPQDEQSQILKKMSDPNSKLKLVYVTPEKISKAKGEYFDWRSNIA